MKNYRIDYTYDGYRFFDVVRAESAEQAISYLMHLDSEHSNCQASETEESPSITVPAGWTKPQPINPLTAEEIAENKAFDEWCWNRAKELGVLPEDICTDENFEAWKSMQ